MKANTIITIGRQFGSGGHEIAVGLSEKLGIPYYDKEIIVEAAKKSGLNENLFKNAEEQTVSSFLYSVALGAYTPANSLTGMPFMNINETIFQEQSKVIVDLASRGSCVIVGRCADYILKEQPECYRFFMYADLPARIERIKKLYDLDDRKAEDLIVKTDKKRGNFYHYYTGKKWNDLKNYDLCLNTAKTGAEGAIETILSFVNQAQK